MVGRFVILAALACCAGGEPPPIDAAPDGPDDGLPDLETASWVLDPVIGSGDDGFVPHMSFTGDGSPVVVWQRNDASAIGFAFRQDAAWFVQFIDAPAGVSGVFAPDVAGGSGGKAHIVFSGSTQTTSNDVFYVLADGGSLSTAVNITSPNEGGADFDSNPAVAAMADDEVTVLYTYVANSMGMGNRELRALTFTNPGLPTTPVTVVDAASNCTSPRARASSEGIHAILNCDSGGADEAVYLTNRSGAFVSQVVNTGTDTVVAPDLDIATNGDIHIVVQGQITCPQGMCTEPLYSLNLSPGAAVTGGTEDFFSPAIALDAFDRPIFVFFDLPGRELFWTFSEGAGFFRPQQIDLTGDKLVGTGEDDPATGMPFFALEDRSRSPSIWVAQLVAE